MFLGKLRQVKWAGLEVIAIAALIFVFSPVLVAASQIHFDIDVENTGQISWAGTSNALVGTNIAVSEVTGLGTLLNNGITNSLIGGSLDFITGGCLGSASVGNAHSWTFDGGGTLTLIGGVDTSGDGEADIIAEGTSLMSGTFLVGGVTHLDYYSGTEKWFVTFAAFTDEKNEDLLDYYGMPHVDYYGNFNISFEVTGDNNVFDGFTSTQVLSGDISNYPVPISASALLLGSGLVGLIAFGQRMRKRVS